MPATVPCDGGDRGDRGDRDSAAAAAAQDSELSCVHSGTPIRSIGASATATCGFPQRSHFHYAGTASGITVGDPDGSLAP